MEELAHLGVGGYGQSILTEFRFRICPTSLGRGGSTLYCIDTRFGLPADWYVALTPALSSDK